MNFLLLLTCIIVVLMQFLTLLSLSQEVDDPPRDNTCSNSTCRVTQNPYGPLVNCSYLPDEFLKCEEHLLDLNGNQSEYERLGYGCFKWGGQKYGDVERSKTWCSVLDGIECDGDRRFLSKKTFPCIKYNGHYFVTTLIYSILLGFLGMDRFCLGHTGTAVGKLLTVGGVGIWWIVDIILLVTGELRPADGSNWVPYY